MESRSGNDDGSRRDAAVDEAIAATRALATALDLLDHTAAQRLNVGRSDLRILDVLSRHGGTLSPGSLASQVGLSRPALSAALNRLEQRDLVERGSHPSDRRSVLVNIAPAAEVQLSGLFASVREQVRGVLRDLSPAELQLATAIATRLASSIEAATATAQPGPGRAHFSTDESRAADGLQPRGQHS